MPPSCGVPQVLVGFIRKIAVVHTSYWGSGGSVIGFVIMTAFI